MYIFMLTSVFACLCSAYLSVFVGGVFWVCWNTISAQFVEVVHIPFYQWFIISFIISLPILYRKIKAIID